ncbi:MAG: hypothetical protein BWK73_01540 [Thiothrix lacustris]|uniref:Uncharacterized protein n=1 Tax=Thiothrix lacustris TaxID=525917 RepID=A0A1Y1QZU5_9GAMM|nr:MAG: hypothetical protein BWK73_01540 [Thiothrix lacustris]
MAEQKLGDMNMQTFQRCALALLVSMAAGVVSAARAAAGWHPAGAKVPYCGPFCRSSPCPC